MERQLEYADWEHRIFSDAGTDAILLRCMSSLTERFLVPLNRYFGTLLLADQYVGSGGPTPDSSLIRLDTDQTDFQHRGKRVLSIIIILYSL